jgi:photosystem II stability/assembly factor-like uncharacterized protein
LTNLHRTVSILLGGAVGLGVGLASPDLRANGRFPTASQLVVDPMDASHMAVVATYGLLETFDAGENWSLICEAAYGAMNGTDPPLGIMSGGTMIAGTRRGLSAAQDARGCAWVFPEGPLQGEVVADLAVEPGMPSHAVAVTSTIRPVDGSFAIHVLLAESLDGGQSWHQAGTVLPDDILPFTVEVAPSDPRRVYVSGASTGSNPMGLIERSDDRGATWRRLPVMPAIPGANIYISAVDPKNPDIVYARVSEINDTLLVSTDGAETWTPIYQATREMLGFALSPDGTKIALGGLSNDLQIGSTSTYAFGTASTLKVRCLTWTASGLYACADEQAAGFSIGLSADEGKSFRPLYHFQEHCPLECPLTSPTAMSCGTTCDAGTNADASLGDDASVDEREPDVGEVDRERADQSPAEDGDGAPRPSLPAEDQGCGCALVARPRSEGTLLAAIGLAWLAFRRRTRSTRWRAC